MSEVELVEIHGGCLQATDRLKTPEELAKKEKERLDALEADRQRRMKGITDDEKPTHVSADDLNDGYVLAGGVRGNGYIPMQKNKWNAFFLLLFHNASGMEANILALLICKSNSCSSLVVKGWELLRCV